MVYVNFNRTKPASFALSEDADKNTIYFTTDTHEIIINGEAFGTDDLSELQKQIEVYAEGAEVIAADLNDLTTLVNHNSENITSLESVIVENELTTSAALNDLNNRLLDTIDTATIDAMFI